MSGRDLKEAVVPRCGENRFRTVILLFVVLSLPLRANLGDTVEQCVKRYGKPIGFSEAGPTSPFGTMVFTAAKFTLIVFLLDTKEVGARVSKTDKSAFTDDEMKTIMNADSDPALPWTSGPSPYPSCLAWTRGDKATVLYDKDKHMLIFTSVAMKNAIDAFKPAAAPAPSPAPVPVQTGTAAGGM
jgi:hypothetical protein